MDIKDIYSNYKESFVKIEPLDAAGKPLGSGSGTVLCDGSNDCVIVTANHNVDMLTDTEKMKLSIPAAKTVDESFGKVAMRWPEEDMALVVPETSKFFTERNKLLELESKLPKEGDSVLGVGFLYGSLQPVLSPGKVTNPSVEYSEQDESRTVCTQRFIEANQTGGPGDSGGTLLSASGKYIGMIAEGSPGEMASVPASRFLKLKQAYNLHRQLGATCESRIGTNFDCGSKLKFEQREPE